MFNKYTDSVLQDEESSRGGQWRSLQCEYVEYHLKIAKIVNVLLYVFVKSSKQ